MGSFIARRLDKRIAANLLSAVMHGIYAGDIWRLSARTLLAQAWQLEALSGSIYSGMFRVQREANSTEWHKLFHPYDLDLYKAMREETRLHYAFETQLNESAMFTFKNGMAELISALQTNLENNKQVDFKFSSPVRDLKLMEGDQKQVEVTTGVSFLTDCSNGHGLTQCSLKTPCPSITTTSSSLLCAIQTLLPSLPL